MDCFRSTILLLEEASATAIGTFIFVAVFSFVLARRFYQRRAFATPDGKAVLVTGCDSGIGFEAALFFDKLGFTVFAGCLFPDGDGSRQLKQTASGRLTVLDLDVTRDDKVDKAFKTVSQAIDSYNLNLWSVVNNAGVSILGFFEWLTPEQNKKMLDVNLIGQIRVTRAFLPLLKKSKGRLVNVSSVVWHLPFPGTSIYSCTKYAIEGLSDILRVELQVHGVKVIIIEPGDHSKQTDIMKLQSIYESQQWEYMSAEQKAEVQSLFRAFHGSLHKNSSSQKTVPSKNKVFNLILKQLKHALLSPYPSERYLATPFFEGLFFQSIGYLPTSWKDAIITYFVEKAWKVAMKPS